MINPYSYFIPMKIDCSDFSIIPPSLSKCNYFLIETRIISPPINQDPVYESLAEKSHTIDDDGSLLAEISKILAEIVVRFSETSS
ncbi:MAG: hypothetical protein L0207_04545 [Chlamydiae bacterium]|nr:hypothetical protein [Chlamydiota bacterium]